MKKISMFAILIVGLLIITMFSGCVGEKEVGLKPYQNPDLPIEKRIDDLLKRMTLEEKIGQMMQVELTTRGLSAETQVRKFAKEGVAPETFKHLIKEEHIGSVREIRGASAEENALALYRMQKFAVEESRLGIPLIISSNEINGVGGIRGGTVLPHRIGMASTWDPGIVRKSASIAAKELRTIGIHMDHTPSLDIARDPRWGRVHETYGEDPYLSSVAAVAEIKGYQGNDLAGLDTIVATPKHFVAYGETEGGRDAASTDISERTLREVHLVPFKAAVDAGAGSIMTAYQSLNGIPCSANKELLAGILKEEWGFEGFVITDWDNVGHMIEDQHVAKTLEEAIEIAVRAGNDMYLSTPELSEKLPILVKEGKISEELIDESVRRILRIG
jgi:beta-glucosidase